MMKKIRSLTREHQLYRLFAMLELISFLVFYQVVLLSTIAYADDCELKKWRLAED